MAQALVGYALSTVARVKVRLGISASTDDTLLLQLLNEATDFVQAYCQRVFKEGTYTQEIYSGGEGWNRLWLRNYPVASISSFQERSGGPASPSWSDMNSDVWEAEDAQVAVTNVQRAFTSRTGCIRIYGGLIPGVNNYRLTYVAGYKIDFASEGAPASHDLPLDLTGAAESLVGAMYVRRRSSGVKAEALGNHSVTWGELVEADSSIKSVLDSYKRTAITF